LQKFTKVQKNTKRPIFPGEPLQKILNGIFFPTCNFFVASRYRETPHLQPTIADQGRPEPTRADQRTKMADDRRCLVVTQASNVGAMVRTLMWCGERAPQVTVSPSARRRGDKGCLWLAVVPHSLGFVPRALHGAHAQEAPALRPSLAPTLAPTAIPSSRKGHWGHPYHASLPMMPLLSFPQFCSFVTSEESLFPIVQSKLSRQIKPSTTAASEGSSEGVRLSL
jgi:hypothetical protein